jgi:hypothetical protein
MGRNQISTAPIFQRSYGKLTVCGLTAGIGHPRAFIGVPLPVAKGANSPMVEFLDVVAHHQPDCAELRDALDQGGQSRSHRWLFPLSLDDRGGQEFVLPKRLNVHVDEEPFLLRILPTPLEECQNIFIPTVAAQRWRVVIPE